LRSAWKSRRRKEFSPNRGQERTGATPEIQNDTMDFWIGGLLLKRKVQACAKIALVNRTGEPKTERETCYARNSLLVKEEGEKWDTPQGGS